MRQRGKPGRIHVHQLRELAEAVQAGKRPGHPYLQKVMETRGFISAEYGHIAKALYAAGYKTEARLIGKLAKDVAGRDFDTRAQKAYDQSAAMLKRQPGQVQNPTIEKNKPERDDGISR